jgi:hypothetical protein
MVDLIAVSWSDVWTIPWTRAVACIVVLCILIAVGFYVVSTFRDYADNDRPAPYFANSNLQEMLRRGDISEAEFRTIQSKSHGVSVQVGDPPLPLPSSSSLGIPSEKVAVDASRDDEKERPNSFLPPSET